MYATISMDGFASDDSYGELAARILWEEQGSVELGPGHGERALARTARRDEAALHG